MKIKNISLLTIISLCTIPAAYGMEKKDSQAKAHQDNVIYQMLTLARQHGQNARQHGQNHYDEAETLSDDDDNLQHKHLSEFSKDPKNKK